MVLHFFVISFIKYLLYYFRSYSFPTTRQYYYSSPLSISTTPSPRRYYSTQQRVNDYSGSYYDNAGKYNPSADDSGRYIPDNSGAYKSVFNVLS